MQRTACACHTFWYICSLLKKKHGISLETINSVKHDGQTYKNMEIGIVTEIPNTVQHLSGMIRENAIFASRGENSKIRAK